MKWQLYSEINMCFIVNGLGNTMKGKVRTIISLSREDQDKEIAALHGDELKVFITELMIAAQENNYDIGMLKIADKLGDDDQKKLHVHRLLRKFPEVPSGSLALDRKFADQRDRMLAIIDDINYNRLPASRYHELLHENLREGGDFEGDPIITRTFLTFSLAKVTDKQQFLKTFKSAFGFHQFEMYCNTPNYIDKGIRVTLGEIYLDNYGSLNLEERQSLTKKDCILLGNYLKAGDSVAVNNVNTHNISSIKSADESHVAAFQSMLAAEGLGVVAHYPFSTKVKLTQRGTLDTFVTGRIESLKHALDAMAGIDDAALFEKYVCHTLEDSYKSIKHVDLDIENKHKVTGFRFQLHAAQRYVDDMLTHRCEGRDYPYETNVATENGLTMEEMLATAYWATTDRANFRNEQVTPEGNLVQLVRQLYDIRRGYDIDGGTDQPEASPPVFPENPETDQNRCLGGSVNSLPWGLASAHLQYNPRHISRSTLGREIKRIYTQLILEEIAEFQQPENKEALRTWNLCGKITGSMAEKLKMRFKQERETEFVRSYKGYISDQVFQEVINNGLNDVPVPDILKFPIEQMSPRAIYNAIVDNKLPLLHLEPDKGCESTLNYLQAIATNQGLIVYLFKTAKREEKQSITMRVMFFLSRCNLTSEQKNFAVLIIKENAITIGDIGTLTADEYKAIYKHGDLLAQSIANQHINLFALYACKFGFTPEQLATEFGPNGQTPLLYAASINRPDIIMATLKMVNGNGETPLQAAVYNGNRAAVKAIWDAAPELFLSQLEVVGRRGKTLLHFALSEGNEDVAEVILMTIQGKQDIRKRLLETQDFYGTSFLQTIGNPGILKMVLDCNKDFPELLKDQLDSQDILEQNILHKVVDSNHIASLKTTLKLAHTSGLLKSQLTAKDRNGNTPLEIAVINGKIEAVNAIVEFVKEASPALLDSLLKMQDATEKTLYDKANVHNQNEIAFSLYLEGARPGTSPQPPSATDSPVKRQRPAEERTQTSCTDLFSGFNLSSSTPPIDACFFSGTEKMMAQASQAKTESPAKKTCGENDEVFEQTILHKAVDSGDIYSLKTMLERAVNEGKIEAVRAIVEFVQKANPGLLDSLLKMKVGKGQTLYDIANAENQNGIAFLLFTHGAKSGACPQLSTDSPVKRQRAEEGTQTGCTDPFEGFYLSSSTPPIDACFLSGAEKMMAQASQAKTPSPAKRPRGENDEGYSPVKQLLFGTTPTPPMDAAFLSSSALPVIADKPVEEGAQVSHAKTSSPTKRQRSEDVEDRGSDGKCASR